MQFIEAEAWLQQQVGIIPILRYNQIYGRLLARQFRISAIQTNEQYFLE